MRSSNVKTVNPLRIGSAPPDEGEPEKKSIPFNYNAPEFNPNANSFEMYSTPMKSRYPSSQFNPNYSQKKELNYYARDFKPTIPQTKPNNFVFNAEVKSFTLNSEAIEFEFKLPSEEVPIQQETAKNQNDLEKNIKGPFGEKNQHYEGIAKLEKKNTDDLIKSTETVEPSKVFELGEKEICPAKSISEITGKEENTENGESTNEEIQKSDTIDNLEQFNDALPEVTSKAIVKKIYDFEAIRLLKHEFVKDPQFLIVSDFITKVKEREVEIVKVTNYKKRGENRKPFKEVVGHAHWRKSKSELEEKISKKAKENSRKFNLPVSEQEKIKKQIRITLNKLSPNNLEKLTLDIAETCKKSYDYLKLVVVGIFEKSWAETKYTSMYSNLCKSLKNIFENFTYPAEECKSPEMKNYFKYELLYMCEQTFELTADEKDFSGLDHTQREEKASKIKKKILGNVRFIGELFNVGLITAKIVLGCVNSLLDAFESERNEDKLEGACVLLLTGGASFERSKLKVFTDEIYARLQKIFSCSDISSKNKFKVMDLIEFRANGWKGNQREEARKIEDIHKEFNDQQNDIYKRHGYY